MEGNEKRKKNFLLNFLTHFPYSYFHFSLFFFFEKGKGEGKKKEKKNKKEEREKGREKEKTAGYSAVKWRNNQPSEKIQGVGRSVELPCRLARRKKISQEIEPRPFNIWQNCFQF